MFEKNLDSFCWEELLTAFKTFCKSFEKLKSPMMPLYHRNIIVDNSRVGVDNARVGPEELIDIKKGFFKVPKKAAGKGSRPHPKRMNFRKSSRGGGSFSIQKFMLQNLDL